MLDTLVAAVSPELADAVAIALALDPRERYETAREMGRALQRRRATAIAPAEPRRAPRAAPATAGDERARPAARRPAPSEPERGATP